MAFRIRALIPSLALTAATAPSFCDWFIVPYAYSWMPISNFDEIYSQYMSRKMTKTKMAELCEVSRPVMDRLIKEYEKTINKALPMVKFSFNL